MSILQSSCSFSSPFATLSPHHHHHYQYHHHRRRRRLHHHHHHHHPSSLSSSPSSSIIIIIITIIIHHYHHHHHHHPSSASPPPPPSSSSLSSSPSSSIIITIIIIHHQHHHHHHHHHHHYHLHRQCHTHHHQRCLFILMITQAELCQQLEWAVVVPNKFTNYGKSIWNWLLEQESSPYSHTRSFKILRFGRHHSSILFCNLRNLRREKRTVKIIIQTTHRLSSELACKPKLHHDKMSTNIQMINNITCNMRHLMSKAFKKLSEQQRKHLENDWKLYRLISWPSRIIIFSTYNNYLPPSVLWKYGRTAKNLSEEELWEFCWSRSFRLLKQQSLLWQPQ